MTEPLESPLRLAMWSGPRNVSTALMRSFEARGDCAVVDEPLYAHYLKVTGLDHPGADEVVENGETDWRQVTRGLCGGDLPQGTRVHYQKHMAQHLLDGMAGSWLDDLTHAFLIREPRAMLASFHKVWPKATLADTGLPQQVAIFERIAKETGDTPPVIDSKDLLLDPEAVLSALCERVGIEFTGRMLAWPAGPRETDGIWAPHWYASVWETTGFQPYAERPVELPSELEPLAEACAELYAKLHAHRLVA